jgi:hypothetical protein
MADRLQLNGWAHIAGYLGVSIRAAQGYERKQALPIHRLPGSMGRVWAQTDELDAWRIGTLNQTSNQKASSVDVQTATDGAAPSSALKNIRSKAVRKLIPTSYSAAAVMVVLVLVGLGYTGYLSHGPPADFRVQGSELIAINAKSRELWRHKFSWPLRESAYAETERFVHSWIGDLDGSGEHQFLFDTLAYKAGSVGTPVICFHANGKIKWQFEPGRIVTDRSGDRMIPPYPANSLEVIQAKDPSKTRIVVSSNHYVSQANQVAILDIDGRVAGEYWHPGHLLHLEQVDLEGTGRNMLLLAGVNNGDHRATLVVLDPLKIIGLVTPKKMQDHRFELLNMSAAHEKAVVLFPRSCVSIGQPYTRATAVQVTKERIIVMVAEGYGELYPGLVYELDYGLHVVNVVPAGIQMQQRHQELEAQGKLDHPFDAAKECERLKAEVIVRRSEY